MPKLSFDHRSLLVAYKQFFDEEYPCLGADNTVSHIQMQELCFLLSIAGINIGDTGYLFGEHGAYSIGLESQLRTLDQNEKLVSTFYRQNTDFSVLFSDEDKEGSLFTLAQLEKIKYLKDNLLICKQKTDICEWMTILGSFLYLSKFVLPTFDYDSLLKEYTLRTSNVSQSNLSELCYKALICTGLIE